MNVDKDVLLIQARELQRRDYGVLLFLLIDVNLTVSCQYTEGERSGCKHQRRRDLPVAENARHGALGYNNHDRQGRCFGSRETVWKLVRKFRVSGLLLGCFGGWETKGGNQETCGKLTYLDTRNSLSGVREREILRKRVGNRWETQRFGTMSAVSSPFPQNFPLTETPKPFLGARNIRETCRKHHDS